MAWSFTRRTPQQILRNSCGDSWGLGPNPGSTVYEYQVLYRASILDEPMMCRSPIDTLIGMSFACSSTSPTDDAAVLNATETFVRQAQDYSMAKSQYIAFLYSNYTRPFQNPIASYRIESQKFLRAVSKEYDQHQDFQKLVPGGFKLYRHDETWWLGKYSLLEAETPVGTGSIFNGYRNGYTIFAASRLCFA